MREREWKKRDESELQVIKKIDQQTWCSELTHCWLFLLKPSADQYLFNAGPSQCPVPSDRSREAGANTFLELWLINFAKGESSMVSRLDPRSSDQDGRHPACKLTCFLTPFISCCYLKTTIVECDVHKVINLTPIRNHTKFCHF